MVPNLYALKGAKMEEPAMFNNSTLFIGIDLGGKLSYIVILDQDGKVIEESRIPTTKNAFIREFKSVPLSRIAMEVGAQLASSKPGRLRHVP
jgi:activator of 2-hydroxyglutaryl-CoA dehydratase